MNRWIPLLLVLLPAQLLFAQEDWSRLRVSVTTEDHAARDLRVERKPNGYRLLFPVLSDERVWIGVDATPEGGYVGSTQAGLVGALLPEEQERWWLEIDPPALAFTDGTRFGVLKRGVERVMGFDGEVVQRFTLRFSERTAESDRALLLSELLPEEPALVPGVGAPLAELEAQLERRPDELLLIYWNVGKGEHRDGPPVEVAGAELDPVNANVRALAALKPDFLVLSEVPKDGLLDADTDAALAELLPSSLWIASIKEFPHANNNVLYSRFTLGRGVDPKGEQARVSSAWLDWAPAGLTGQELKRYRARWTRNGSYHTRVHTRVDLELAGQPCTLFPVHYVMPWTQLTPQSERGGFVVDGVQDHQLHREGPLYHQVALARAKYAEVAHGRVAIFGDTNVTEFPQAAFPPIRVDPNASGDGAPARERALAFELLADGYQNAFAGDRQAFSWPNPSSQDPRGHLLPRQLLDNALVGSGFEVRYRAVAFPRGSDHGALILKVRLRSGGPYRAPRAPERAPQPDADADPPRIVVSAPARGARLDGTLTVVAGRVEDASPIRALTVAGTEVPVLPDGSFHHPLFLAPGLNVIELRADDVHGNRGQAWRSVASGPVQAPGLVRDALALRLSGKAFKTASGLVASRLTSSNSERLLMAQNPLIDDTYRRGRHRLELKVEATALSHGTPTVSLTPTHGGLQVELEVPDLTVYLRARGRPTLWGRTLGSLTLTPSLRARRAKVSALAAVSVQRDGLLRSHLIQPRIELEGFALNLRLLPGFAREAVNAILRSVVEALLTDLAKQHVPPAVDGVLAKHTQPLKHTLLGHQVTVNLAAQAIRFEPGAAHLLLAADVDVRGGGERPALGSHTGSLATPTQPPVLGAGADLAVSLGDDLLNRIGHATWRSGALNLSLRPGQRGLPSWTRGMNAGWLKTLLPEAGDALASLPANTPIEIALRPLAPPIFAPRAGGELEVGLGDLQLIVRAAPTGAAPVEVLRASLNTRLRWSIGLNAKNKLFVRLGEEPAVHVDVYEGLTPLKRHGVEALVAMVVPMGLEKLTAAWSGFPLPIEFALRAANPRLSAHGEFTTLSADVPF